MTVIFRKKSFFTANLIHTSSKHLKITFCLTLTVHFFQASLSTAQADFDALAALDQQIKSFNVGANPYTWFNMEALEETWRNLQKIIAERDVELTKEAQRQEENDKLRKEFAKHANAFHQWLTETRYVFYFL